MRSPRRSVRRAPGRDGVRPPARGEGSRAEFGSHAGREPESWRPQVPRHLPPPQPPNPSLVPPRTGRHSELSWRRYFLLGPIPPAHLPSSRTWAHRCPPRSRRLSCGVSAPARLRLLRRLRRRLHRADPRDVDAFVVRGIHRRRRAPWLGWCVGRSRRRAGVERRASSTASRRWRRRARASPRRIAPVTPRSLSRPAEEGFGVGVHHRRHERESPGARRSSTSSPRNRRWWRRTCRRSRAATVSDAVHVRPIRDPRRRRGGGAARGVPWERRLVSRVRLRGRAMRLKNVIFSGSRATSPFPLRRLSRREHLRSATSNVFA